MVANPEKEINFDPVAGFYDRLGYLIFGKSLILAQKQFLNYIPAHSRILILGGGTGKIIPEILRFKAVKEITYLESSPRMIEKAKKDVQNNIGNNMYSGTIIWINGNENQLPENKGYDVVIAFFFLDLFTGNRLDNIFKKISLLLKKNGIFLFADFQYSGNKGKGWWQKLLVRIMYGFFGKLCHVQGKDLPEYGKYFQKAGFKEIDQKLFFRNFIISRVLQFHSKKEIR